MENHEKKRIHGSRRELGAARSVDLAVLVTKSLDYPAYFRSLSADAPDDCGHPSVSTSVFQVAELGAWPHRLVLGESLGYGASSAVGYNHRRKRRESDYSHWLETLHGLFSATTRKITWRGWGKWKFLRFSLITRPFLKRLRKYVTQVQRATADPSPTYRNVGTAWSIFKAQLLCTVTRVTNIECNPLDLNTQVGVTSYYLWNNLDTYHAMLEHKIIRYIHIMGSKLTCQNGISERVERWWSFAGAGN